jgi:hypothetical protein
MSLTIIATGVASTVISIGIAPGGDRMRWRYFFHAVWLSDPRIFARRALHHFTSKTGETDSNEGMALIKIGLPAVVIAHVLAVFIRSLVPSALSWGRAVGIYSIGYKRRHRWHDGQYCSHV